MLKRFKLQTAYSQKLQLKAINIMFKMPIAGICSVCKFVLKKKKNGS